MVDREAALFAGVVTPRGGDHEDTWAWGCLIIGPVHTAIPKFNVNNAESIFGPQ